MEGLIVKGIGGFYYVLSGQQIYSCRARGIFKKDGITPMIGDLVEIEEVDQGEGVVNKIFPRKNSFIRPPIANVDVMAVVVSAASPAPNLSTINKFLVMAEESNARIIMCINKIDMVSEKDLEALTQIYEKIYPVFPLSAVTGQGVDSLKNHITEGKIAFVGPSGVGKSTLINKLHPSIKAETGEVSLKTARGKHTTRHVELFSLESGAMVYDTPGFTSFDILEASIEELHHYYPEMEPFIGQCKYDDCRHIKEPKCAVIEAVEKGIIHKSRYGSYLEQIEELRNRRNYG